MWDTGAAALPAFAGLRRWGEGPRATNNTWLLLSSHSSRTRMSCVHPQQRRQPSTWTRPWQPVAPTVLAAGRTRGVPPTWSSPCTCTSTVWRSVGKAEVGAWEAKSMGLPCPRGCLSPSPEGSPWASLITWVGCGSVWVLRPQHLLANVFSVSGGRSRLHLIDLGSCEAALGRGGEASGGPLCLSLSALGSVILALVNGAKHVPYR